MLTPVLWAINPVSLKLDCEQVENSFTPIDFLPFGEIYGKLNQILIRHLTLDIWRVKYKNYV
jgi:hypothetical protein